MRSNYLSLIKYCMEKPPIFSRGIEIHRPLFLRRSIISPPPLPRVVWQWVSKIDLSALPGVGRVGGGGYSDLK